MIKEEDIRRCGHDWDPYEKVCSTCGCRLWSEEDYMSDTTLFIEITFPMKGTPTINTDVKHERVSDFLVDWMRATQIGQGKDDSEAVEREEYRIGINIDLADDSFTTKTDTGNKGLTCGIVMNVVGRIEKGDVIWA